MIFFKILFFSSLFLTFSFSKTLHANYSVEFGIFGEVAKIYTIYTDDTKHYTIDTHLSAVGFLANKVTHHLKEQHICKGYIGKNKKRIATSYQMHKSYGEYRSMTLYEINHKIKTIKRTFKKWLIKKGKKDRIIQDYSYNLDYYAVDDMVSLFLNLSYKIKDKYHPKHYTFKVAGADREHGDVDITIPTQKEAKVMSRLLGKPKNGEWLMNLVMHRQLYNSNQGELMVRMDSDSSIKKAVLKDLIFFGDVRISRK